MMYLEYKEQNIVSKSDKKKMEETGIYRTGFGGIGHSLIKFREGKK